ncbi:MAG: RpiB/LacA/LacB family sugar-phosphate isomerase [Bacilli bacterium]|nr:RpiB/LacA/LacB family sugar-phosphate isomerase [Bacilli bacterium]
MKIGIASDHRGYETKKQIIEYLKEKYEIIDYGTNTKERVDYPIYGIKLGEKVAQKEVEYGIAICGSAIGISIACNKVKGIRCGKINTIEEAIHAKENDHVNIIAISGETDIEINKKIVDAYLNTKENTKDPSYLNRVNQIIEYENDR